MSALARYERFRDHNRTTRIVAAEWLDVHGEPAHGHPDTWKKLSVRFEDGSRLILPDEVMTICRKRGFKPRWKLPN